MAPAIVRSTRLRRVALAVAAGGFVLANLVNSLTKGGDFTVFLESGRRLLQGEPLYAGSRVAEGVIGPPFQALLFVPFAMLAEVSEPASRLAWYALNLVALSAGVAWWRRALGASWRSALLALLAIAHPLQSNFQHQNLNVVLLAASGAAAVMSRRHEVIAGAAIGLAAALKAFPGLLLMPFLLRGRWRALAWGVGTATLLTLLPALRYGIAGWQGLVRQWLALSGTGGWPIRSHNQSLFAMIGRWLGPEGIAATGALELAASPTAYAVWVLVCAMVVAGVGWTVWRGRHVPGSFPGEMALTLGAGVLVSPIAWDHYWVLFYPALLLLAASNARPSGTVSPRTSFWAAALLVNLPALLPREAWRVARWVSLRTLAGLLVVGVTAVVMARTRRAPVSPSPPSRHTPP